MKNYKCDSCDEDFRTSFQLRNHFGMAHPTVKTVIVEMEAPEIKPVLNIWSGDMVFDDPFEQKPRMLKSTDSCVVCGGNAYTMEHGQPICYGYWSTWGCHYKKYMIDEERKWFKLPCRHRNTYDARPLTKKERKKTIKQVVSLEHEVWARLSWTPLDELEKWHDDKLRREVRSLEFVRANPC